MSDHTNTYPDLVNVEDWLNAKGYTGEAGACHQAISLIRSQEKRIEDLRKEADMMHSEYRTARARIAELETALKPFAAVYDENYALIGKWHDGGIQGLFLSDLLAARAALEKKDD
jgi:hypothetical protein